MPRKPTMYYQQIKSVAKSKTLTLRPGNGKAVGLGVYAAGTPVPNITLTYQPDLSDDIGVIREKLDVNGKPAYELLYQFHNYSSKPCKIKIQIK